MKHSLSIFNLVIIIAFISVNQGLGKVSSLDDINNSIISNIQPDSNHRQNVIGSPSVVYPDMFFEFRLESLNKTSPIKLDFNVHVRKYIDMYLKERPNQVAYMIGMSDLYFPIFESYLDKYNLPMELKYLPFVESALNSNAQSRSGAMGLWQLMLNSSKLLGVQVSSYIDERCDPYVSTDAACRYLRYLYSVFNDWQLTLAAYNGGPGEVRNAIIRSGGKTDFWEIQSFLPEQTKWYVPAFIAAVYIGNYANEHGIKALKPIYTFNQIDTIHIDEAVEFVKLSEKLEIPIEYIRFLNPKYRRDFIPDFDKPQVLVMPTDKVVTFFKKQHQIYAEKTYKPNYIDAITNSGDTTGLKPYIYTVNAGDFIHKIALENGCTPENIKAWNQLQTENLNAGQRLTLWLDDNFLKKGRTDAIPAKVKLNGQSKKEIYYTVKKGDTLWSIAERFGVASVEQLKHDNHVTNNNEIQPGQKLKINVQ